MIAAGTLAMAVAGCRSDATTDAAMEHAHERPPHHPLRFRAAAPAIRTRALALTGPADTVVRTRVELLDILRWLPQLAADTDLCRKDWDEVAALAAANTARLAAGRPEDAAAVADDLTATALRIEALAATCDDGRGDEEP
ncbi:MAG: hypothetical protein ACKOCW_08890 [Planctomycetaceae bacterium]